VLYSGIPLRELENIFVTFQAFKKASMYEYITPSWDIAQCSLVEVGRLFIVLMMEAVHMSETSVYLNETRQHYSPEM
jgi:hypothetical protein